MKKLGFVGLVLCFTWTVNAQQNAVHEPQSVQRMMDHFIKVNKDVQEIDGWRIQIATTTDRREMDSARSKFRAKYPGVPISWKHVSPYYHVKVGAYESKLELQGFLFEVKRKFPSAIAVRDKIEKTDLL